LIAGNAPQDRLIPGLIDQYLCAQSRIPMEIMRHGCSMSLFQA
jgi:hypothetical protein